MNASQESFYKLDTSDMSNSVIARISRWFKKAKPRPNANDFNTQLGVHFEEIAEMLDALEGQDYTAKVLLMEAREVMSDIADYAKGHSNFAVRIIDRKEFLDSLCDQIVTATGCGVLLHMDVAGGIEDVADSNQSKFEPSTGEPIFNEQGKIMKGPAYRPPSLARFV